MMILLNRKFAISPIERPSENWSSSNWETIRELRNFPGLYRIWLRERVRFALTRVQILVGSTNHFRDLQISLTDVLDGKPYWLISKSYLAFSSKLPLDFKREDAISRLERFQITITSVRTDLSIRRWRWIRMWEHVELGPGSSGNTLRTSSQFSIHKPTAMSSFVDDLQEYQTSHKNHFR